jgi:hypothetical protein
MRNQCAIAVQSLYNRCAVVKPYVVHSTHIKYHHITHQYGRNAVCKPVLHQPIEYPLLLDHQDEAHAGQLAIRCARSDF